MKTGPASSEGASLRAVRLWACGLAGLGLIGLLDWGITIFSLSTVYLLPVAFITWHRGRGAGFVMSILAASVWFVVEYEGVSLYSHNPASMWQALSRLIFNLVTAFLVNRIHVLQLNLEDLVGQRKAALEVEVARRKELEREAAEIAEREQERVAHELHDQLAPHLAGIAFRAKSMGERLERSSVPEAADARNLALLTNKAIEQVRSLARMLAPIEEGGDLAVALSRLGAEMETVYGVTCVVEITGDFPRLTDRQSVQLYRIAQEALRNAVQHSQSDVMQVTAKSGAEGLTLTIACEGKRWDPTQQAVRGLGIHIMRHRAEQLGGKLVIQAGANGGTVVTCEVPFRNYEAPNALRACSS